MIARHRRLPVPAFVAALAATLTIAAPSAKAANCPGADAVPATTTPAVASGATLCLINAERSARGLAPLATQSQLEGAGASYSQAMVQQHFFAHSSPSGEGLEQRLSAYISGVTTWDIGENLAWGEGSYATPAAVVTGWMNSEGHRANILNTSFREVGIGIAAGTPGGSTQPSATYTAEFGSRVVAGKAHGSGSEPGVPTRSAASPTAASASTGSLPAAGPPARTPAKKVSPAKKRWITAQCARIARKTRSSRSARQARQARCVQDRMKAAARG